MSVGIVKSWYGTAAWKHRRQQQLVEQPLCCFCEREGRVRLAQIADHVVPHKGDPLKFWTGELQSLCVAHHSSDKQMLDRTGRVVRRVGVDGWPVDE